MNQWKEQHMADQQRKNDIIRSIEHLQLPASLLAVLEDGQQAECLAHAIDSLQDLSQQWNWLRAESRQYGLGFLRPMLYNQFTWQQISLSSSVTFPA